MKLYNLFAQGAWHLVSLEANGNTKHLGVAATLNSMADKVHNAGISIHTCAREGDPDSQPIIKWLECHLNACFRWQELMHRPIQITEQLKQCLKAAGVNIECPTTGWSVRKLAKGFEIVHPQIVFEPEPWPLPTFGKKYNGCESSFLIPQA